MQQIRFWNGNKSQVRQQYELAVMEQVSKTLPDRTYQVINDLTELPKAEQEGNVLNGQADVLVTVAGNGKFAGQPKIAIDTPIAKGLLGHRLLIVKRQRLNEFVGVTKLTDLQDLRLGIPATWVDAELFRRNDCKVVERGSFDELFERLKRDEFDYVALGANEILDVYQTMIKPEDDLVIHPNLLLYYPFPLVFYVAANQLDLADYISRGIETIAHNGELNRCFDDFYGAAVEQLKLQQRHVIHLRNPFLDGALAKYQSPLLS